MSLVEKIVEAAEIVYQTLADGYDESVYEQAMAIELANRNLHYTIQPTVEIKYQGHKIGEQRLDFIIENEVAVELKANANISKGNAAQLRSYLHTTGLRCGVLIDFPYPKKDHCDVEVMEN